MKGLAVLFLLLAGGSVFAQPSATWEAALAAEAKELEAEHGVLQRSLKEAKASTAAARRALEADVERLTSELSKARADNATRSQRLPDAARAHSLEDQARQMKQTTDQIHAWATTRNVEVENQLVPMVRAALAHVEKRGGLHVDRTEYFGEDGIAREGNVLHIGEVGAIVEGDPPLPLVLAGDGSLRVARGVERGPGSTPAGRIIGTVLFDPLESHTPQSYHELTWRDWMRRGGPIMWPIALLGMIALLIGFERAARLIGLQLSLGRLRTMVARNPRELADVRDPVFASLVLVATMQGTPAEVESEAVEALRSAKPNLRRGVSFLGVVAAVSPLIGLLGTVTGMIGTFAVITEHGTGDPRLLSAGISEALLTTQLGLAVAVPALLVHTALLRWGDLVLTRVEALALAALEKRPPDA